jgi:hypothetical protein
VIDILDRCAAAMDASGIDTTSTLVYMTAQEHDWWTPKLAMDTKSACALRCSRPDQQTSRAQCVGGWMVPVEVICAGISGMMIYLPAATGLTLQKRYRNVKMLMSTR